ncbi:MAG: helix-turn-helix domain-containing protein [Alphaproteobacteria bacterium]|nr:helix-turn-helix domain-containing protein [Alphaproteobacteria bacterium]
MTKKNFERIMAGLNDAVAIAEGRAEPGSFRMHIPSNVDVKALRRRLGLTQEEFAVRYGFTVGRIRDWEQGRTSPAASDRVLLTVLEKEPDAVKRALEAA